MNDLWQEVASVVATVVISSVVTVMVAGITATTPSLSVFLAALVIITTADRLTR